MRKELKQKMQRVASLLKKAEEIELFCYGAIPDRWSGLAGTY